MDKIFASGFADDLKNYIAYRKALGYSENTYYSNSMTFDRYCNVRYPSESTLSERIAMDWATKRQREKNVSLNGRVSFLRGFARYQISIGKDAYVIPKKFVSGSSTFVPYLFSDAELTAFFHEIDTDEKTKRFTSYVLSTIFRLIYTCGLRPGEGRMLKTEDINFNTGEIMIRCSKKRKDRIVVMSNDMLALSRHYVAIRDVVYPDSEYFFPSPSGSPFTTDWVTNQFKRYFARIYPEVPVSDLPRVRVYDLRHRFATACLLRWIEQGIELNVRLPYLRTYMGHSTLNETLYYIHILPENLVAANPNPFHTLQSIVPEVTTDEDTK